MVYCWQELTRPGQHRPAYLHSLLITVKGPTQSMTYLFMTSFDLVASWHDLIRRLTDCLTDTNLVIALVRYPLVFS